MEHMTTTETPDIEAVLREAGPTGLTVVELIHALDIAETTVRRRIKTLIAQRKVHKVPTMEGQRIVYGDGTQPIQQSTKPSVMTNRRRTSQARDDQVAKLLEDAGPLGLELEDVAQRIQADDITEQGFSQKTYLSLRRGKRDGRFERIIRWRLVQPGAAGAEPAS